MSNNIGSLEIVIGETKKGSVITVLDCCKYHEEPHFKYYNKNIVEMVSMLEASFIDSFRNLELEDRTDLEIFLNSIVDIKHIKKVKRKVCKMNRKVLKNEFKYILVDEIDVEKDMTYWELIVKVWNKNNKYKMPKNLLKPYYRNFIEYVDGARFSNKYQLEGGMCYTKQTRRKKTAFCISVNNRRRVLYIF